MKDCAYVLQFTYHAAGCCEYVVVPCSLLSIEIITCVIVLSIYCLLCQCCGYYLDNVVVMDLMRSSEIMSCLPFVVLDFSEII
jgi:hypothetical protein